MDYTKLMFKIRYNSVMKIFYTMIIVLFLGGCAQKDAFSRFGLTKEQRLSENSIQTAKIKSLTDKSVGMVSVIYLNEIYPEKYTDGEYFYIYYYVKEKQNLEFILNNIEALSVEKLTSDNKFAKLLNSRNSWNKYILVKFKKTDDYKLTLKLKDKNLLLKGIVYKKED